MSTIFLNFIRSLSCLNSSRFLSVCLHVCLCLGMGEGAVRRWVHVCM